MFGVPTGTVVIKHCYVCMQVCYKGESDAALITFANHAQATAAYQSPEPVFNNRFVEVFWQRKDDEASRDATQAASTNNIQVRKSFV